MIATYDWETYEFCQDLQLSDQETNARMRVAHQIYPDGRRQRYELAFLVRRKIPREVRMMIVEFLKELIRSTNTKLESWLGVAIVDVYTKYLEKWERLPYSLNYIHETCKGFCATCGEPNKDRKMTKYLRPGIPFIIPKISMAVMVICYDCTLRGLTFDLDTKTVHYPPVMPSIQMIDKRRRERYAKVITQGTLNPK